MTVLDDDIRALLRDALLEEPAPLTAHEVSQRSLDNAWLAETAPRPLPKRRLRSARLWVAPIVALAAIAVVVVGLIAIGANRNQSVGNNPARWHWLLRDVPSGWKATTVFDSTTDAPLGSSTDGFERNMYATDAEPLGPVLIVERTTDPNQTTDIGAVLFPNALGYEELELDGRRAALATLPDNAKGLYVEINLAWVSIWSRGVSDEALRGLGRTLTADAAGHYDVAASALPKGMHKIDMAALQNRDYVSINYAPSTNDGTSMYLSIAPAAATPLGHGEFVYEFTAVSVDGFSGFLGSRPTGDATTPTTDRLLLWRRDGLDFLLFGRGVTSDQILTAAASASPAAPDEWAHLLDQGNAASNDTIATGTAPPAAPVDTEPAFVGAPRDLAITVTVDDVSNTEQQWSGVLPTGQPWSAKVTRVYDHVEMRSYSSDGTPLASLTGSIDQLIGGGQVTCCSPMAITKNPNATAMRLLLPNGDRYTIPLHHLPGTDDVRIAFIPIPDLAPLTELVDADGDVLESYTPH
jgi:hypothetical protein